MLVSLIQGGLLRHQVVIPMHRIITIGMLDRWGLRSHDLLVPAHGQPDHLAVHRSIYLLAHSDRVTWCQWAFTIVILLLARSMERSGWGRRRDVVVLALGAVWLIMLCSWAVLLVKFLGAGILMGYRAGETGGVAGSVMWSPRHVWRVTLVTEIGGVSAAWVSCWFMLHLVHWHRTYRSPLEWCSTGHAIPLHSLLVVIIIGADIMIVAGLAVVAGAGHLSVGAITPSHLLNPLLILNCLPDQALGFGILECTVGHGISSRHLVADRGVRVDTGGAAGVEDRTCKSYATELSPHIW